MSGTGAKSFDVAVVKDRMPIPTEGDQCEASARGLMLCGGPAIHLFMRIHLCMSFANGGAAQFEAFARGFMMLCGGPAIHLFSATELERLVCGTPLLDFEALRRNARYEGGYSAGHQARCLMAIGRRRCRVLACRRQVISAAVRNGSIHSAGLTMESLG